MGYLGMAPKGSSVIQAMLKRLAEEEAQQKQNEAKVSGRRSRAAQGKDRRSLRVFRRQQPSRCSGWKSGNGSFAPQGGMSAKPGSDPAEGRRAWGLLWRCSFW